MLPHCRPPLFSIQTTAQASQPKCTISQLCIHCSYGSTVVQLCIERLRAPGISSWGSLPHRARGLCTWVLCSHCPSLRRIADCCIAALCCGVKADPEMHQDAESSLEIQPDTPRPWDAPSIPQQGNEISCRNAVVVLNAGLGARTAVPQRLQTAPVGLSQVRQASLCLMPCSARHSNGAQLLPSARLSQRLPASDPEPAVLSEGIRAVQAECCGGAAPCRHQTLADGWIFRTGLRHLAETSTGF